MNEPNIYLSDNLKYLRIKKGLTQTQMGAIVGAKWQRYQKWEHGFCQCSLHQLFVYARKFKVKPKDLLYSQLSEITHKV